MGSVIPCRKHLAEERGGAGGAPSNHLAEQRQITGPASFSYRRYTVAEEAGLLHELPDEQERLAQLLESLLTQPTVSSGVVRPKVMEAAQAVIAESTAALDYLRDK
jgi:hypothetical protein